MISKVLAVWALCLLLAQVAHGCLSVHPRVPMKGDSPDEKYTSQILGILTAQTNKSSDDIRERFFSYGCYCGPGGEGIARDELDKCCQEHDSCYGKVKRDFWLGFYELEYSYNFNYTSKQATCVPGQGDDKMIKCDCDLCLGACMKKNWDGYKKGYEGLRYADHWQDICKYPKERSLLDKLKEMYKP